MTEWKAIFIGDLHLGKPLLAATFGAARATEMQLEAVRRALDLAIARGITRAVYVGDISDAPTLSDADELAFQNLLFDYDDRLDQDIILGNHDVEQKDVNSLCKIENLVRRGKVSRVRVFSGHHVDDFDGLKIEYMAYPHSKPQHTDSICIAHLGRAGARRDNGSIATEGAPVPAGRNVWVLGHFHTPQEFGPNWFCGTLYQTNRGEGLDKRILEVEVRRERRRNVFKGTWHTAELPFKLITVDAADIPRRGLDNHDRVSYVVTNRTNRALGDNFLRDNPSVRELVGSKAKREDLGDFKTKHVEHDMDRSRNRFLRARGWRRGDRARASEIVAQARLGAIPIPEINHAPGTHRSDRHSSSADHTTDAGVQRSPEPRVSKSVAGGESTR